LAKTLYEIIPENGNIPIANPKRLFQKPGL
jgi:hypothetical protein